MQLVKAGKKIPVVTFENGKVKFWSGVIPIADNILQWQFFDKRKGDWVPLGYGETRYREIHELRLHHL